MNNIIYTDCADDISCDMLKGFFVGWRDPLGPRQHLQVLHGSDHCILALDGDNDRVVGFVTAISDKVLSAYIPLLEVLVQYQDMGIGSQLVRKMLTKLQHCKMVDIVCDEDTIPFYQKFGFKQSNGMILRR